MTRELQEGDGEVSRMLKGTAAAIASVRTCWLVTATAAGAWHARPMGGLHRDLERDDWRMRFVADGRSRKTREIRGAGRVAAIFQHGEDAFGTLIGVPSLRRDVPEAQLLLKKSFDTYFPTGEDRANAAVIEIDIQEMELWIRGVTPEPFGLQPTRLERDAARAWHLIPPVGNCQSGLQSASSS
jgi:general stress protein 26